MGATVDGEPRAKLCPRPRPTATTPTTTDDEDGLNNPAVDLALTIGAQPTVNVIVTNTTGSAATLYGWIDYNGDGVFDNASERAQARCPTGPAAGS